MTKWDLFQIHKVGLTSKIQSMQFIISKIKEENSMNLSINNVQNMIKHSAS